MNFVKVGVETFPVLQQVHKVVPIVACEDEKKSCGEVECSEDCSLEYLLNNPSVFECFRLETNGKVKRCKRIDSVVQVSRILVAAMLMFNFMCDNHVRQNLDEWYSAYNVFYIIIFHVLKTLADGPSRSLVHRFLKEIFVADMWPTSSLSTPVSILKRLLQLTKMSHFMIEELNKTSFDIVPTETIVQTLSERVVSLLKSTREITDESLKSVKTDVESVVRTFIKSTKNITKESLKSVEEVATSTLKNMREWPTEEPKQKDASGPIHAEEKVMILAIAVFLKFVQLVDDENAYEFVKWVRSKSEKVVTPLKNALLKMSKLSYLQMS